ncbi:MAG: hypothetical protein F9K24_13670 [Leptonema illini]|uniref:cGAS/DncV-like nucleotidyltransferase C-terminal helical domain-containing protein n=1 Tax=Leptonema illini TaxID=183 RepID=A0A833M0Q9_9LEPT|nr:MAG: hypothetical protein F9K24_13670 [Leptonema illini]
MDQNRLSKLRNRRTDEFEIIKSSIMESLDTLTQTDSVKYVLGSMQPIEPTYTQKSYEEADRIKNQIENKTTFKCSFDYQGSVTNNTHIKAKSDIDLLTILTGFITLERPQEPDNPYKGNPVEDLFNFRNEEINILQRAFPEATIDTSGSKSIGIEGGSLRRKIDVVPSNWFNSNRYKISGDKTDRGIQILNTSKNERILNYPFLHNKHIADKDSRVNGGLRRAVRLMKSLKYDSENIELSSYDITAIGWNIPDHLLVFDKKYQLGILETCLYYCKELESNYFLRSTIEVPNGTRKVFAEDGASVKGLTQLRYQLESLSDDIQNENHRSFDKLSEARIEYF